MLTDEKQRQLIKDTVKETLLTLGLDVEDPIQLQRDFTHLREWRETTESLKSKGFAAVASIVGLGMLGMFLAGFKDTVKGWVGG